MPRAFYFTSLKLLEWSWSLIWGDFWINLKNLNMIIHPLKLKVCSFLCFELTAAK